MIITFKVEEPDGSTSPHAANHAAAGSDPVTLAQSQITGLVDALAAKIATSVLDTDIALTANSDLRIATQKAVKAFVAAQIAALVNSSPAALDTLKELSDALGADANFATTMTNALAGKVPTSRTVNGHSLGSNVTVTKSDVGLGSADNTADADKPVSTAQASADTAVASAAASALSAGLALKSDKLITERSATDNATLILSDADTLVSITHADPKTWTVPPNSDVAFPLGTQIAGAQYGAGVVTLTAGVGVTLESFDNLLQSAGPQATWAIWKKATDTWKVIGKLA